MSHYKEVDLGKKYTIEEVRESFESEGYTLLSDVYVNKNTKMDYICNKGHAHKISWGEWHNAGNRCPYCSMKIRKTIEEVEMLFEREGYILLSSIYVNVYGKMRYICPNGHQHEISMVNWNNGHRCPYCVGQVKPSSREIKESFEKEGYTLLSCDYKTNRTLMDYKCPIGHIHKISWLKWKQGRRCRECSYINRLGPNSPNWKGGISSEPYCCVWADKEYKNYIRSRDGDKCLNPCCDKNDKRLHIHHVDYDKKNCRPSNLITVCGSCNSRANYDREWHMDWYKAILRNRYNYNYKEKDNGQKS